MNVITCSRQLGARGGEIISVLARELGMEIVDKESIEQALTRHGIPEDSVDRYDEKKPGFWSLISADRERYYHYLKTSILEAAANNNRIVVGRGAPVLLAGIPGVLHIRVVAPMEIRLGRVMKAASCDEHHARKLIRESDQNRAGFYRFFFDADWDSPELYDLVINTAALTPTHTLGIVRTLLDTPQYQDMEATELRIRELTIAQHILTRILLEERIPVRFPAVEVHQGVATIHGTANSTGSIDRCRAVAEATDGISSVEMLITHAPEVYEGPFM